MMRTIDRFDPTPKSSYCLGSTHRAVLIVPALLVTSITVTPASTGSPSTRAGRLGSPEIQGSDEPMSLGAVKSRWQLSSGTLTFLLVFLVACSAYISRICRFPPVLIGLSRWLAQASSASHRCVIRLAACCAAAVVLVACAQSDLPESPTSPGGAALVSGPTAAPTATPTPVATPTAAPTATPTAVATPTAAPTATPTAVATPTPIVARPSLPLENGDRFVDISSGSVHTCSLRGDGAVVCWGSDRKGQSSPPEGGRFVAISSGYNHTCALRHNRSVVCWGWSDFGQASPPE